MSLTSISSLDRASRPQHFNGVDADRFTEELNRFQCQVTFAAFHATHVGAMDTYGVGKLFLAQPTGLPKGAQIGAEHALQITRGHVTSLAWCYS